MFINLSICIIPLAWNRFKTANIKEEKQYIVYLIFTKTIIKIYNTGLFSVKSYTFQYSNKDLYLFD